MLKNRYPSLWNLLTSHSSRKNVSLFFIILIPNFLAAVLEGISFALILAGLSVLSGDPLPFQAYFPAFILNLSQNELFISLIIFAVIAQGSRSLISGIALYANSVLSLRLQEEAQLAIYRKIFNLSFSCVSQYKIGDLAEYAKTPPTIINVIMDQANRFLISSFMILATLSVMFLINYKLAFLTLLLLVITALLHKSIIRKIGKSSQKLSGAIVDCSKHTMQALQSMRTIHTFNRQNYIYSKIRDILDQIIRVSKKVYFWNNFIPSINELLGILFVSGILLTGMWILSENKEEMLPVLITFIALTHRLAIRLQHANTALGTIISHQGSINRLEEILSDRGQEFSSQEGKPFTGLQKEIHLKQLGLQYPASIEPAIRKISIRIPKGTTAAFVGTSGAGKSSLLDLLLRLYDPTHGCIEVDGENLNAYSIGSWRDRLGVVSQDISIFNDTIEENIRFGLKVSPEQITRAAKLAGLDEFIQTLPEKYQTVVGERGFRLSGGQRQRLALARALIRDPELLILDEATSNLDSISEHLIQLSLEKLRSDKTILIVAHRLSTIMNADIIYVLEQGQIQEQGTHASLLEQNGIYARLWKKQAETETIS